MAIIESNTETKLKFVHLLSGLDGVQKQRTTTMSNLVKDLDNESLYAGAEAVASLFATEPVTIVKATEVTLSESV